MEKHICPKCIHFCVDCRSVYGHKHVYITKCQAKGRIKFPILYNPVTHDYDSIRSVPVYSELLVEECQRFEQNKNTYMRKDDEEDDDK